MNEPQLSAEMKKRFDEEFGSVYCSTAGAKVDEYLRVYSRCNIQIKHFLATALEEQRMRYIERLGRMSVITMIQPGKFGDGKPTQIPTDEWGEGYNEAIDDVLAILNGKEE